MSESLEAGTSQIADAPSLLVPVFIPFMLGQGTCPEPANLSQSLRFPRRKLRPPPASSGGDALPAWSLACSPSPCAEGDFSHGFFCFWTALCSSLSHTGAGTYLCLSACSLVTLPNSQCFSPFFNELTCHFIASWQISPCGSSLFDLH